MGHSGDHPQAQPLSVGGGNSQRFAGTALGSGSGDGFLPDGGSDHSVDAPCLQKALLENLRFHDLRHEATSRFFERTGLDVMEITVFAGRLKRWMRLFRLFADVFKMDIIFCI